MSFLKLHKKINAYNRMLLCPKNIQSESTVHLLGGDKFSTQRSVQLPIVFHTEFKLHINIFLNVTNK